MAFLHEGRLLLGCVDQENVGVAAPADFEGLARPDCDDVDAAAALRLEVGQDGLDQPRVDGARRGRQPQHGRLRHRAGR